MAPGGPPEGQCKGENCLLGEADNTTIVDPFRSGLIVAVLRHDAITIYKSLDHGQMMLGQCTEGSMGPVIRQRSCQLDFDAQNQWEGDHDHIRRLVRTYGIL